MVVVPSAPISRRIPGRSAAESRADFADPSLRSAAISQRIPGRSVAKSRDPLASQRAIRTESDLWIPARLLREWVPDRRRSRALSGNALRDGGWAGGAGLFECSTAISQRIPGRSAAKSRDPLASQRAIRTEKEPRIPASLRREWVPDRRRLRALSGNAPRDGGWVREMEPFVGSGPIPQRNSNGLAEAADPFLRSAAIPQRIPGRSAAESRDLLASQRAIGIELEPRIPSWPRREWVPDRWRLRALSGNAPRDGRCVREMEPFVGSTPIPQRIPGGWVREMEPFVGSAPIPQRNPCGWTDVADLSLRSTAIPQRIPGRSAAESRDPLASQRAIGIELEPRISARPRREWVPDRRRLRALSGNALRDGGWAGGTEVFVGSTPIPQRIPGGSAGGIDHFMCSTAIPQRIPGRSAAESRDPLASQRAIGTGREPRTPARLQREWVPDRRRLRALSGNAPRDGGCVREMEPFVGSAPIPERNPNGWVRGEEPLVGSTPIPQRIPGGSAGGARRFGRAWIIPNHADLIPNSQRRGG